MALTNKSPSETYKDLLYVDNSNSGIDSTARVVKSGNGNSTSISVSDRATKVTSSTDNTSAFSVVASGGTTKLLVDTTNSYVQANGIHVNTQYKTMGLYDFSPTAGYHYPMVANSMMFSDGGDDIVGTTEFGNGTDPATTWDCSAGTPKVVNACLWFVDDNIDIDGGTIFVTSDNTQVYEFHLYSYAFSTGIGTLGDLSGGTLLATASSGVTGSAATTIRKTDLSVSSASVASGRVIVGFIEAVSGTDDITVNAQIKYHITS